MKGLVALRFPLRNILFAVALPRYGVPVIMKNHIRSVMVGARMGAYRISEQTLGRDVLQCTDSSMLILADRGFTVYPLWWKG